MKFDDILEEIGQFGPYQKRIYTLLCFPALCVSSLLVVNIFTLGVPDHRCKLPGVENDTYELQGNYHQALINATIPAGSEDHEYDECHIYAYEEPTNYNTGDDKPVNGTKVKCTAWVYDTTVYKNTFAKKLDLVCDNALKTSHAQTIMFSGVLFGSVAFGQVSDIIGRRKTLYGTLWLLLASGIAISFSPEYISYCIFMFLVGAGCLGLYMTAYVLGMELVGPIKRKWTGNIIQVVLTCGQLYLVLMVYLIRDWTYFQLAVALPLVLFLPYYWLIPESCRWLLNRERKQEVIKILNKAAKVNKTHFSEKSVEDIPPALKEGRVWQLFSSRIMTIRTLIIYFNWFVCSMSYYGSVLNIGNLGGDLYLNFALMVVVEFPAKLAAMYFLDRTGRKKLHITFMIIGGAACIGTIFPILYKSQTLHPLLITLALIGKSCITGAFGTLYVWSAELYPTVVRNSGMGSSSAIARVGSMLAPYIAKLAVLVPGTTGKAIPLTLFGVVTFVAGLLTLILPETLGKKLPETIEDAENFTNNDTGLLEKKRTVPQVPRKSEELEQIVKEQDKVQIIPTEKEALDEDKDEPKVEEYETKLQVEEPAVVIPFAWAAMESKNTNNMPSMEQIMTQIPLQTNMPPPKPQEFDSQNEVNQETSPTTPQSQRVSSNDTGLSKNELTKSLVRPKSEEIEQKVEEEDEVQIIPTEKEALDNGKDEPRMEEYETELQVEELAVVRPFAWAAMESKNANNMLSREQIMTQIPLQTNKPPPEPQGFDSQNEVDQESNPTTPQPQRASRREKTSLTINHDEKDGNKDLGYEDKTFKTESERL